MVLTAGLSSGSALSSVAFASKVESSGVPGLAISALRSSCVWAETADEARQTARKQALPEHVRVDPVMRLAMWWCSAEALRFSRNCDSNFENSYIVYNVL